MSTIFKFEDHRPRFKSNADYDAFVADLRRNLEEGALFATDGNSILAYLLSPAAAKEIMYHRLRNTILSNPTILDQIKTSLNDDDLVDLPPNDMKKNKMPSKKHRT